MSHKMLLGQIVYSSFAAIGFRTVTSAQITPEIQQAFMERVVYEHWNSYKPPKSGFRGVYIHQVTPEQVLFGWLYNDGTDDIARGDVPYFVCYYLSAPLLFYFQLEEIFNCLHSGPLAWIDRYRPPVMPQSIVLQNARGYKPVRPGVAIPAPIRARSHIALKQGDLLNLFVPFNPQENNVEMNPQAQAEEIDNCAIYTRYLVKAVETGLVSLNDDFNVINDKIKQPYQGYKKNLQRYEQAFVSVMQRDSPIPQDIHNKLKRLQHSLHLIKEDIARVEARFQNASLSSVNSSRVKYNFPLHISGNFQLSRIAGITAAILAITAGAIALNQIKAPLKPHLEPRAINRSIISENSDRIQNIPHGIFKYSGSSTFAFLQSRNVRSLFNQAHPKFQLRYIEPTLGKPYSDMAIEMLIEGEISFALSSREIETKEFKQATGRGFLLEEILVGIDAIAVYVNPQLSIPGLTISQLNDIYAGKIRNWKAVGGPNLRITLISYELNTGNRENLETVEFFQKEVLKGKPFSLKVQKVRDTIESIRKVATTRGSISYARASKVISQHAIRPLPLSDNFKQSFVAPIAQSNTTMANSSAFINGSYPITKKIFIIVKRDGGLNEEVGLAYTDLLLTPQGQRLIEKAGFVPIL
ncbi:MAG: substrate-binding domain-containing protein [Nostoc sp. ChiSLP02]|nr:substrate-binding domain-containing protein [Nostoc sp. DedSLP05]MDZ8100245.1 substrate-binding domain-containing protein [Nostoc sp. DedSLP01]MDZ8184005.1 substrate-binding domain-containing protein [Nostoc sp. ChiSLP02]